MRNKHFLVLAVCLLVSACGFEPMYGTSSKQDIALKQEFAQVQIENIPNREGQFLKNALIDRFYSKSRPINPRYVLSIGNIHESTYDLDITVNSDSTRSQLTLKTKMFLKDTETGETLIDRNISASSSYNIVDSEFATRVSEQNTRENALNDLARQVELQVALYLKRQ